MAAITDKQGRIMVLMTHNTDIADSWEREGDDPQFFFNFSPNGYAVGLNAVALRDDATEVRCPACCDITVAIVCRVASASLGALSLPTRRVRRRSSGSGSAAAAAAAAFRRAIRPPTSFDGGFNFCRLIYTSDRREAGGSGWSTDYWDADINFSTRLGELTKTTISRRPDGEPNHLDRPHLRSGAVPVPVPERHRRRHGALHATRKPTTLRAYLTRAASCGSTISGGRTRGTTGSATSARCCRPASIPIRDIPIDHPIRRTLFEFKDLPQIPSISFWRQ